MECIKTLEHNLNEPNFINTAFAIIDKISKPNNKIIERLKVQLQYSSENLPVAGYTRMHSRHNRS